MKQQTYTILTNKLAILILIISSLVYTSCDVHQWPDKPETVKFHLVLDYDTQMTEYNCVYIDNNVIQEGIGSEYNNELKSGLIRYIIRFYPNNISFDVPFIKEITHYHNLSEGYNYATDIELPEGDYKIMVWSDLIETEGAAYFYNAQNFGEVTISVPYRGNTNYKDAFRGTGNIVLSPDVLETDPDTVTVSMERPFAKYEFISNDLSQFIVKELEFLVSEARTRGEILPLTVDTDDYNVVFLYAGFMPNTYNMFSDRPTDSFSGVTIGSKLNILNENEASLGFDYVFTGLQQSSILIQIGLFDKQQRQVALSDPINVPLKRGFHTIMKGSFLMQQTSGGIHINPGFDGNHNIISY